MPTTEELLMIGRVLLAFVLGVIIGVEREAFDKPAGLRTHALVAIGAAAFTQASLYGFGSGDPSRIAANIVVGIGFLGAGTILRSRGGVIGLTTAASLWSVASIGLLVGVGLYWLAIATTIVVWVTLRMVPLARALRPSTADKEDADMIVEEESRTRDG